MSANMIKTLKRCFFCKDQIRLIDSPAYSTDYYRLFYTCVPEYCLSCNLCYLREIILTQYSPESDSLFLNIDLFQEDQYQVQYFFSRNFIEIRKFQYFIEDKYGVHSDDAIILDVKFFKSSKDFYSLIHKSIKFNNIF